MASFWDRINPLSSKSFTNPIANKTFRNTMTDFWLGTPEKRENVSTLRPEQEPLYDQAVNAGLKPGAGGAFGTAADYYRNNLSDNPADFDAFAAPQMRQYNEEIAPNIAEQYAGMGSGGLSSSGFQNAMTQGGVDLSERLGAIRANLRHSSAQGLQGIGEVGLRNYSQNMVTEPGTEGFLSQIAPAIGTAVGSFAGPAGAAAGNWFKNSFGGNKVGANSSAYQSGGTGISASPKIQMPNFMGR